MVVWNELLYSCNLSSFTLRRHTLPLVTASVPPFLLLQFARGYDRNTPFLNSF
jgi:hypothetical protein